MKLKKLLRVLFRLWIKKQSKGCVIQRVIADYIVKVPNVDKIYVTF